MAFIKYQDASGLDIAIAFDATTRERHSLSALITEHAVEDGTNISDHIRPDNDRLTLEITISNTPVRVGAFGRTNPDTNTGGSFQAANLFTSRPRRRLPGGPTLTIEGRPKQSFNDIAPGATLAANLGGGVGGFAGLAVTVAASQPITPAIKPVWTEKALEPETGEPNSADVRVLQFPVSFDRVTDVYNALRSLKDDRVKFTVVTSLRTYENMGLEAMDVERSAEIGNAFYGVLELRQFRIVSSETVRVTEPLETRGEQKRKRGNQPSRDSSTAEAEKSSTLYGAIFGG